MASSANGSRQTVVIAHGAWFTPDAWSPVADALRERGVDVMVPLLHRGSLAADTAAVQAAVDATHGGSIVVVGHSYGGSVITGLPSPRVARLVYFAALMPDTDETTLGLIETDPTDLASAVQPADASGMATLDPQRAATLLFGQSSPATAAMYAAALVPQQMAAGHQTPAHAAWKTVPSTYLICDEDRTIAPSLQRRLAQRATEVVTWNSDHTPFVHEPERVAAFLQAIVSGSETPPRRSGAFA